MKVVTALSNLTNSTRSLTFGPTVTVGDRSQQHSMGFQFYSNTNVKEVLKVIHLLMLAVHKCILLCTIKLKQHIFVACQVLVSKSMLHGCFFFCDFFFPFKNFQSPKT